MLSAEIKKVMAEKPPSTELHLEPWKANEEGFLRHFRISYADFCELVKALSPQQQEKYEKIRAVHEEAAILWAIHEGKSHGILEEE